MQYRIYEDVFEKFDKKIQRIINKCKKYGNPFTYKVVGEEYETRVERDDYGREHKIVYRFILVEVEGTAQIDNWELIALLEHSNDGNIIKNINNDVEVPESFRTSDCICEHCRSKRERKKLFIIRNTETGDFKQIGSTCLKSYTGCLSAEYIAAWLDGITEFEEEDGNIGSGIGKHYYKVDFAIQIASNIVDKIGYFSFENGGECSTKNIMQSALSGRGKWLSNINNELIKQGLPPFELNELYNESSKEKVHNMIEYYMNLEGDSNFIHNIQVILKTGYVSANNLGFIAYIPEGYRKHIEKQEEREQSKDEYFGDIGTRYKNVPIRSIRIVARFTNRYGFTTLYKIILSSGNILMWNASGDISDEIEYKNITFTVKDHKEYKGEFQTVVTRCKLA